MAKKPTTQQKLNRALRGVAWSQERLQCPDLDAETKELHQDNLGYHLADAKRLQSKLQKEDQADA